ncbi:hypothetical protein JCM11251_001846 [Rhodosporidiobolus azoricus]
MWLWSRKEEDHLYETVQAHTVHDKIDWPKAYRALQTDRTLSAVQARFCAIRRAKDRRYLAALLARAPEGWNYTLDKKLVILTSISKSRGGRVRWKWVQRHMKGGSDYTVSALEAMAELAKRQGPHAHFQTRDKTGNFWFRDGSWHGRFTDDGAGPIKAEDVTSDEEEDSDDESTGGSDAANSDQRLAWPHARRTYVDESDEDVKPDLSAIRYKRASSADDFLRREAALRAQKREKLIEKEGKGKGKEKELDPSCTASRSPSPLPPPSTLFGSFRRTESTGSNPQAGPSGTSTSISAAATSSSNSTLSSSSSSDPAPAPSSDAPPPSTDTAATSPAHSPSSDSALEKGKNCAISPSAVGQAVFADNALNRHNLPTAPMAAAKEATHTASSLDGAASSAVNPVGATPPNRRALASKASQRWEKELEKATGEASSRLLPTSSRSAQPTSTGPSAASTIWDSIRPASAAESDRIIRESQEAYKAEQAAKQTQAAEQAAKVDSTVATTARQPPILDHAALLAAFERETAGGPKLSSAEFGRLCWLEAKRASEARRASCASATDVRPLPFAAPRRPVTASASSNSAASSRRFPPASGISSTAPTAAAPSVGYASSSQPRPRMTTTSVQAQRPAPPRPLMVSTSTQTVPPQPSQARLASLAKRRQRLEKQRTLLQDALDVVWELLGEVTEEEICGIKE